MPNSTNSASGLLHLSEISRSWIRNIRDYVREKQKMSLKVLRVDHEKGYIDLSLRRVIKRESIEKVKLRKKERIRVKLVKVRGTIEVRCMKPNGIKYIQESFASAKKSEKTKDTKIEFLVTTAPKYSVEVTAENWKRAEELLQKVSQTVVTNVTKAGGQGSFRREK